MINAPKIKEAIAGLAGAVSIGNGATMLAQSRFWYVCTPGVTDTGPFNPHFVQDVGLAFMVAGGGLLARAWRPALWPAAVTGAAFLLAHGGLHLWIIANGDSKQPLFDFGAIVAPALVALWAALPDRKQTP
jgi:hypothetical protein